MTSVTLVGLLPTAVAAVEQAAPRTDVLVEEIVIEGCERIHPDRIRFRLRSRVGAPLSAQAVAEDVRSINTMGPFVDGRSQIQYLDDRRVRLIFTVEELPMVGRVQFSGVGFFGRQGLAKKLTTQPGGHRNPVIIEADRRRLEDHFGDKGFIAVSVAVHERLDPVSGLLDLTFHIDPGVPRTVARCLYPDLPPGAHAYLLNQSLLFNRVGRPFNAEMLDIDGRIVVNALQDLGYLDARLDETVVTHYDQVTGSEPRRRHGPWFAPDGERQDRVQIVFKTTAGERYRLGGISFVGNTTLSEEALRSAVLMAEGDWFERKTVDEQLMNARDLLRNRGHARAAFRTERSYDFEQRRVDLTIHVFEGPVYRVGRVDIDGNTVTLDAAVRRLLKVQPGERYSEDAVRESRRQVGRVGIFGGRAQPPRLGQVFPEDRPGEVDIEVQIHEQPSGQIQANVGYVTDSGFIGQLEYQEDNFDLLGLVSEGRWRGAAQTLRLNLTYAQESSSLNLSWFNPHLFDSDYFMRSSFVLRKDSDSAKDWNEDRIMSTVSFGRYFLNRDISVSAGYRYTDLDIKRVNRAESPDDVLEGGYFDNKFFLDLSVDRTDSRRLPTRGWSVDLHQGFSGMGVSSSYAYTETTTTGHAFLPLLENDLGAVTYLHLRQHNRWLRGQDGDEVPFYHRIFGGGPYPRHRGYRRGRLGPTEINSSGFEVRPGGETEWLSTVELSMPVQGFNDGIRLLAFYDFGWVWGRDESFDLDDATQAAGFGIRFPAQFPIALDFAWLLDGADGRDRQLVHFSLGGMLF